MSKRDDLSVAEVAEELGFIEDEFEIAIQQGPTLAMSPEFGKIDQVLNKFSRCDMCGGRLHFNFVSDFVRNTTHEKSSCPECKLDAKQTMHRLQ